jgi:hypothetical protein
VREPNATKTACWVPKTVQMKMNEFLIKKMNFPNCFTENVYGSNPYSPGLCNNQDLYIGALFLLFLSAVFLIAGWLHLQFKWKPSIIFLSSLKMLEFKASLHCV